MILRWYALAIMCSVIHSVDLNTWELFGTGIKYIAIRNQTMWSIQNDVVNSYGYHTFAWTSSTQSWTPVSGQCTTLTLTTNYLYCINANFNTYRRGNTDTTASSWNMYSWTANDFKAGTNDDLWYISRTAQSGGYTIYQYVDSSATATLVTGASTRVGPTPDGGAYIVNSAGYLYKYNSGAWTTLTAAGAATDVIVGSDEVPYIVTATPTTGGYTIQKWNATSNAWVTLSGIGGISLALDARNNVYVVTSSLEVYRMKNLVYDFCPICKMSCADCSDAATCAKCQTTLCMTNTCQVCLNGSYASQETSSCISCPSGCTMCTSATSCQACDIGYEFVDGGCSLCPDGFSSSGVICVQDYPDLDLILGFSLAGLFGLCVTILLIYKLFTRNKSRTNKVSQHRFENVKSYS